MDRCTACTPVCTCAANSYQGGSYEVSGVKRPRHHQVSPTSGRAHVRAQGYPSASKGRVKNSKPAPAGRASTCVCLLASERRFEATRCPFFSSSFVTCLTTLQRFSPSTQGSPLLLSSTAVATTASPHRQDWEAFSTRCAWEMTVALRDERNAGTGTREGGDKEEATKHGTAQKRTQGESSRPPQAVT